MDKTTPANSSSNRPPDFQALEKSEPNISSDWKASRPFVWLAAFVAAFCVSAFVIVARCLLRQDGETFPTSLAAGGFVAGALASIVLLRAPRVWNLSSACWLAVAGMFVSAWGFKLLDVEQLRLAVLPFAVLSGALLGSLALGVPSSLAALLLGAGAAQPAIRLVIPEAGYTASFYILAATLGVLFLIVAALRRARVLAVLAGVALLGGAAFTAPVNLSRVTVLDGWQFHSRREGLEGAVTLIEKSAKPGQPQPQRLILDNRYIIAGQLGFGEKRLGHLPLLLQPAAKSALFLNANAGVSVAAARAHPNLEKVDCVEPLAEVAFFLPQFSAVNDQITQEPRAKFVVRDIRDFVAAPGDNYDVIVANPTPPAMDRSQKLFEAGFYTDIKKRLAPGGVFVQWLPLFQLDEAQLKTILRTFAGSFSDAQGVIGIHNGELPVFGLVTRNGGNAPALEDIQKMLQPNPAARAFVGDTRDLLGSGLLDRAALLAFAGAATPNDPSARAASNAAKIQDSATGGRLLRALIATAPLSGITLATLGSGDEAVAMTRAVNIRRETLRHYLLGDILRAASDWAKDDENLQREMIAEYLQAFENEPELQMTRQMLNVQSLLRPSQAVRIYQGILKHNPGDKLVKDMLCTAQERDAHNVGVPMPPSPCAPGSLAPPAPVTSVKKFAVLPGQQGPNTNFFTSAGKSPTPAPPAFPSPRK